MENKSEKVEIVHSMELKELLVELKAIDTEIVDMVKASEEAQQLFESKTMIRQKLVDKMKPIVNGIYEGKLGEFETLANITLIEGDEVGNVEVKIVDEVEKFKENKRKAKEVSYAAPVGDTVEKDGVADNNEL